MDSVDILRFCKLHRIELPQTGYWFGGSLLAAYLYTHCGQVIPFDDVDIAYPTADHAGLGPLCAESEWSESKYHHFVVQRASSPFAFSQRLDVNCVRLVYDCQHRELYLHPDFEQFLQSHQLKCAWNHPIRNLLRIFKWAERLGKLESTGGLMREAYSFFPPTQDWKNPLYQTTLQTPASILLSNQDHRLWIRAQPWLQSQYRTCLQTTWIPWVRPHAFIYPLDAAWTVPVH